MTKVLIATAITAMLGIIAAPAVFVSPAEAGYCTTKWNAWARQWEHRCY